MQAKRDRVHEHDAGDARTEERAAERVRRHDGPERVADDDDLLEPVRAEDGVQRGDERLAPERRRGQPHADWHELERDDAHVRVGAREFREEGYVRPQPDLGARGQREWGRRSGKGTYAEAVEEEDGVLGRGAVWAVPVGELGVKRALAREEGKRPGREDVEPALRGTVLESSAVQNERS